MSFDAKTVKDLARGRWRDILSSIALVPDNCLVDRHGPCPNCAGNDRFRYDDKNCDGTWFCNQCGGPHGNGGGGDGFLLIMRMTGWSFFETVNTIGTWLDAPDSNFGGIPRKRIPVAPKQILPIDQWAQIIPVPESEIPESGEKLKIWNPKYQDEKTGKNGKWSKMNPDHLAIVRNVAGECQGMVVRITAVDGRKIPFQAIYAANTETGEMRWVMQRMEPARSLYGVHELGKSKKCVLVLGEKKRDKAKSILSKWPIVSIIGGDGSVVSMDWAPLHGKTVLIWPDNDESGWKAAQRIASILDGLSTVVIVRPPEDKEKGWDLGDAVEEGWTTEQAEQYIRENKEEPGKPWKEGKEQEEYLPEWVTETAQSEGTDLANQDSIIGHYNDIPPMEPYDWAEFPGKAKPKNTIENCESLLNHYQLTVRYNMVKKNVEVVIPGETMTIDNQSNVTIAHIRSIANRNRLGVGELEGYVKAIADRNAYNPITSWIDSKEWDGTDRLTALLDTVKSPNEKMKNMLITRWMISAIAAMYSRPPFTAHGILVFQSSRQGVGKTTWVRNLMPDMLSSQYIRTGMTLDPADKDHVVGAITNWIVELGELGSTLRRDVDRIKAFCTNSYDRVRRPYDRMESEYPRKTVFFASVNESTFLKDQTGNRRFWVVETTNIDYNHCIDMQQVWAQVKQSWEDGAIHYLTTAEQELLEDSNSSYMEHDPIEEMIVARMVWDAPEHQWVRKSATQILESFKVLNPTQGQATRVALCLNKRGLKSKKSNGARFFVVPPTYSIHDAPGNLPSQEPIPDYI